MNWYNLLKLADKRNFLIQQGYKPEIVEWAVKLNNKYAVWLVNMATQGIVRPGEDDEKLKNTLKRFDKVKRLRDFPQKDINQFKSYGDLVKAIEPFLEQKTKREQHRIQETEGAKIVLDNPPYRVLRLDTPEAASKLCRDTEWCVKDPKYYAEYTADGPLYMVEKNGQKYALAHYESSQFMDVYDNELEPNHKFEIVELLKSVTGKDQINNFVLAYGYARDVIGGRFPEGEPAIAQDAKHAYLYAQGVIKGRFPEGEPAIAQEVYPALRYAIDVIGGRFPEGEPVIAQEAYPAFRYARDVIKGRFPEGELAIAQDAKYALRYAIDVIGGRFPEGEAAIARNDKSAYEYARDIIRGRFPEGEGVIAQNKTFTYEYARSILKQPWPEAGVNSI